MAEHAEVFISGTTRDLGSFRREIKDALLTLQIFPIEESNFALAYGALVVMLRELISRCDAVVHIAGFYYGEEPPLRLEGHPRRSYSQIEYDVARELKKPLYLFLATEKCVPDKLSTQSDEEKELQLTHRRAIQQSGEIYYQFTSREEIGSRVRELRFPARSAEAPRRVVNLPYSSLGPLFKGRSAVLADLERRLRSGHCQSIHGLGGVGKTRFAIEYAWRNAGRYVALLYVSAPSPLDLRANLAQLCSPLVLNLPECKHSEEIVRLAAVFRWLNEHSGWFLILDNVDSSEAAAEVEKTLPQLQRGEVVITSRVADWSAPVQATELDVLADEDAAAFLLERTESRRKKTLADSADAAAVARDLGGLALALEQGGAYVGKMSVTLAEYRRRWESRKEEVLAWHDERLMKYPKSLATTWQTTVEDLSPSERKLLDILAWFAPEPIPLSLLEGNIVEGMEARDALAGLASWSLVRWTAHRDEFTVHSLVQEITRRRPSDYQEHNAQASVGSFWRLAVRRLIGKIIYPSPTSEKDKALDLALALVNSRLPSPEWNQKGWQLWEKLAPHCRTLLQRLRGHVLEPKAARTMNQLALWLSNRAEHAEAEPFYRRALAIAEKSFGPDHPNVAIGLNNLAMVLRETSRFSEAEPLFRRALAIDEKSLGRDHPDIARGLNNLALLLYETNRLAEAEPLFRRALAINEKSFGADHPNVAIGLNNLAGLVHASNRLAEAEPLFRRALVINEKSFGPDHPNVALGLNNLAMILRASNRLAEAEPLFRRALAINEKSFDADHPNVAKGLNNLALLLQDTNRLAEAEPLFRRALAINEKSLGTDHPNVAMGLNNLAMMLRASNRLAEAEPFLRRALAIDEKSLGPDHPEVAIDLNNLASLLHDTGRLSEAESLFRRALAIDERSLGPDHPNVATGLNNLAALLRASNRLSEAEPLNRRALQILADFGYRTGYEHPHFRRAIDNYAGLDH